MGVSSAGANASPSAASLTCASVCWCEHGVRWSWPCEAFQLTVLVCKSRPNSHQFTVKINCRMRAPFCFFRSWKLPNHPTIINHHGWLRSLFFPPPKLLWQKLQMPRLWIRSRTPKPSPQQWQPRVFSPWMLQIATVYCNGCSDILWCSVMYANQKSC